MCRCSEIEVGDRGLSAGVEGVDSDNDDVIAVRNDESVNAEEVVDSAALELGPRWTAVAILAGARGGIVFLLVLEFAGGGLPMTLLAQACPQAISASSTVLYPSKLEPE